MIVVDTSVLIPALGEAGAERKRMRAAIASGERLVLPTLVLYEWLRGPRTEAELAVQEALFPAEESLPFAADEARVAAALYRELPRGRGREVDLAIAACALTWRARLWTANTEDFADVPGLKLWDPRKVRPPGP